MNAQDADKTRGGSHLPPGRNFASQNVRYKNGRDDLNSDDLYRAEIENAGYRITIVATRGERKFYGSTYAELAAKVASVSSQRPRDRDSFPGKRQSRPASSEPRKSVGSANRKGES